MVDGQYRVVHLFDNVQTEDWGWSDQIIRTPAQSADSGYNYWKSTVRLTLCPFTAGECTAFLLVYSITSRSSFDSLAAWVDRIVRGKVAALSAFVFHSSFVCRAKSTQRSIAPLTDTPKLALDLEQGEPTGPIVLVGVHLHTSVPSLPQSR
jgi:hypothetical protein